MKLNIKTLILLMIVVAINTNVKAGGNEKIIGNWYTTDKGAIVQIYDCGNKLCGKITWLAEPNDKDGKPKVDKNNPDEKQHNTPIIGLNMLSGFVKKSDNLWEDGKIYDPKSGKTYSCKMTLNGNDLEVRGFIGFSLFGRTEHWTKTK